MLREAGLPVPLPVADHPILEIIEDMGWFYPGPDGPTPFPSVEILAWAEGMGDSLTPWEFSMIRRMSAAFCGGVKAEEAPYQPLVVKMGLATASFEAG